MCSSKKKGGKEIEFTLFKWEKKETVNLNCMEWRNTHNLYKYPSYLVSTVNFFLSREPILGFCWWLALLYLFSPWFTSNLCHFHWKNKMNLLWRHTHTQRDINKIKYIESRQRNCHQNVHNNNKESKREREKKMKWKSKMFIQMLQTRK